MTDEATQTPSDPPATVAATDQSAPLSPASGVQEPVSAAVESTPALEVPTPTAVPVPETSEPIDAEVITPQQPVEVAAQTVQANTAQPTPTPPASAPAAPAIPQINDLPARGLAARKARTAVKLQKILALAAKHDSITNDDVEKLLRVSDATTSRYLAALVKKGSLTKEGSRGHVRYRSTRDA